MTNLVINTDRRTYLLELRSTEKTYMASVSWQYPQDQLIALRRQNAEADAAAPIQTGVESRGCGFATRSKAMIAPWRPTQVFDDGTKVYIEFPRGIAQGEMPPLFVIGPEGGAELVNYRGAAKLLHRRPALCGRGTSSRRRQAAKRPHRAHRRETAVSDDAGPAARGDHPSDDIAAGFRLRPDRPHVMRLSRKVLAGLAGVASFAILGTLIWALYRAARPASGQELFNTDNKTTPDGLAALPKDYTGLPQMCRNLGRPCRAILAGPCSTPIRRPAASGFETTEQRIAQESEAARTSQLFSTTSQESGRSSDQRCCGRTSSGVPNEISPGGPEAAD